VRRFSVTCFIVCVFAATFLSADPGPPLFVAISPMSQTVKKGYDVRLNLTLTNISKRALSFVERNPVCDYPIRIQDSNGNQPPQTVVTQESHCEGMVQMTQARRFLVNLKPGESYADEMYVSFYYDLRRTGTYTVQVFRHLPSEICKDDIPSNTATFVVTERLCEEAPRARQLLISRKPEKLILVPTWTVSALIRT